jgi:hypothetical protein
VVICGLLELSYVFCIVLTEDPEPELPNFCSCVIRALVEFNDVSFPRTVRTARAIDPESS